MEPKGTKRKGGLLKIKKNEKKRGTRSHRAQSMAQALTLTRSRSAGDCPKSRAVQHGGTGVNAKAEDPVPSGPQKPGTSTRLQPTTPHR